MSDLIKREDAIRELVRSSVYKWSVEEDQLAHNWAISIIESLPSADAESDDLIIKGAKGIKNGLYNIKDGKLFQFKAKGGTVRTYTIVSSADAVQGWIPVSERLPTKRRSVLITTNDDFVGEACYWATTGNHVIWKGYRWEATYCDDEVIAWMPLPKPYREENEE